MSEKRKRTAIDAKRGVVFWVEQDKLTLITDESRPLFDPSALFSPDPELVQSLIVEGQVQELLARRNGPLLEIIDGNRRYKAGCLAGKKQGRPFVFRVRVVDAASDAEFYRMKLAANLHKKAPPTVEAQRISRFLKAGGTEEEAMVAVGAKSVTTVHNKLALLRCCAKVQRMVDSGELTETIAVELSGLTREKQEQAVDEMEKNGTLRGEVARRSVKAAKSGKKLPTKDGPRPLTQSKLEKLSDELSNYAESSDFVAFIALILGDEKMFEDLPSFVKAAYDSVTKAKKVSKEKKAA